ncbi:MAG: hypothetical protein GC190_19300 [Alphaproteobacteria bacterium]|nr:hypothetical protein [Alphaproteobacteria bacterium]
MANGQWGPQWPLGYKPSPDEWNNAFARKQDANDPTIFSQDIVLSQSGNYCFDGTVAAEATLPALSTTINQFFFKNAGSAILTISAAGTDTLYLTAAVSTVDILPGSGAFVLNFGSYWAVVIDTPSSSTEVNAVDFGYNPYGAEGDATANALALNSAILYAASKSRVLVIPGGDGYCANIGHVTPPSGPILIRFDGLCVIRAPGDGLSSASDITWFVPDADIVHITGDVQFHYFKKVISTRYLNAGANFEMWNGSFSFYGCGRSYDYDHVSNREDYNGCVGTSAGGLGSALGYVRVENFSFFADDNGTVCDFGFVCREGAQLAIARHFVTTDGMSRIGVMIGDNATWDDSVNIVVEHIYLKNIYPRWATTTENQVYGILCYGRRLRVGSVIVENLYDLHPTTHNSNGFFSKCTLVQQSGPLLFYNCGREVGGFVMKGTPMDAAGMLDPDAATNGGNGLTGYAQLDKIIVVRTAAFTASYGRISGCYLAPTARAVLGQCILIGSMDRAILCQGSANIAGPVQLYGDFTYGVNIQIAATDDYSEPVIFGDIYLYGKTTYFTEARLYGTTGTLTVPEISFDRCRCYITDTTGLVGVYTVNCYISAGQNTVTRASVNEGCELYNVGGGGSYNGVYVLLAASGSGGNNGKVTTLDVNNPNLGIVQNYAVYVNSGNAGDITNVNINGARIANTGSFISGASKPTNLRIRSIAGPHASGYTSERRGVATITSGNTSVGASMGFATNLALNPDTIDLITLTPAVPGHTFGASLSGSTLTITADSAVGSDTQIGWRALCKYHV